MVVEQRYPTIEDVLKSKNQEYSSEPTGVAEKPVHQVFHRLIVHKEVFSLFFSEDTRD